MEDLETLKKGGFAGQGLKKLKLSCPLAELPTEIFALGDTLEHLDLSGTGLSRLHPDMGQLKKLKIAFFSNCKFTTFPSELAACPELEMVAFRGNGMTAVPENSLPANLRWLILTNNAIEQLPQSIGRCSRLEKCMLAGNKLRSLPEDMARCTNLGLLRLSANDLDVLPAWLFELPQLAFLSVAGNPCAIPSVGVDSSPPKSGGEETSSEELAAIDWMDLEVGNLLGEGASGSIYKGVWNRGNNVAHDVAIKLFRGDLTSDGTPLDEMQACKAAGSHPNLIDTMAVIRNHPERQGLAMQLVPSHYLALGLPPSLQSCTRDCYRPGTALGLDECIRTLRGIASAGAYLHGKGISHCDLYAHNILVDGEGHALLGDFGAASVYAGTAMEGREFERLEVLAFAHLIEDLVGLVSVEEQGREPASRVESLKKLHGRCASPVVRERPLFNEIELALDRLGHRWGLPN